jgi:hypothetical protein
MSSVGSRIIIERYVCGGFGVFIDNTKDKMGLDRSDAILEVIKWLEMR